MGSLGDNDDGKLGRAPIDIEVAFAYIFFSILGLSAIGAFFYLLWLSLGG